MTAAMDEELEDESEEKEVKKYDFQPGKHSGNLDALVKRLFRICKDSQ